MNMILTNTPLESVGIVWILATYAVTSTRLYLNLHGSVAQQDCTTKSAEDMDLNCSSQIDDR
ncbi:hypothetical protein OBBRIDRAFT_795315 [Obba rivulosa]|uniref:Uncharacterized protein n=1 Tax=Obba rivulosa TaxID=1052685 RepID=A0A8E2AP65_9APHY|nr:hypothetical protein OBBRIDRAFT_795315 [Obba rivulosa]